MAKTGQSRTSRQAKRPGGSHGASSSPPPVEPAVIWAPRLDVAVGNGPRPDALSAFEAAVTALQRHDYRKALVQFERVISEFPGERALLDRARVYATLCGRELHRAGLPPPGTLEERLTAATAALNNDEDSRAEQLLELVLAEAPNHELGYYLLAVVHARRGATGAAIDALGRAIAISPDVRAQARHDVDFEFLRGTDGFERLMGGDPPSAHSGNGRLPHP